MDSQPPDSQQSDPQPADSPQSDSSQGQWLEPNPSPSEPQPLEWQAPNSPFESPQQTSSTPIPPPQTPQPAWQATEFEQQGAQPPVPSPSDTNCPNCGRPVLLAARFCPHCGTLLPAAQSGKGPSIWHILGAIVLGIVSLIAGGLGACFVIIGGLEVTGGNVEPMTIAIAIVSLLFAVAAVVGMIKLLKTR